MRRRALPVRLAAMTFPMSAPIAGSAGSALAPSGAVVYRRSRGGQALSSGELLCTAGDVLCGFDGAAGKSSSC